MPPCARPLLLPLATAVLVTLLIGCRWREGRSVWIERYDADLDADLDALDEAQGACPAGPPAWIDEAEATTLIAAQDQAVAAIDTRPAERFQAGHIPGAVSHPWDGAQLLVPLELDDVPGWLLLYDENGSSLPTIVRTLPDFCQRQVVLLQGGFGAWAAAGLGIEGGS